jgi:hypothetical protein
MKPIFERFGYVERMSGGYSNPYGPGCYLEVDPARNGTGKGFNLIREAMSEATGAPYVNRTFPDFENQIYTYTFSVDGPNGQKIPAIAELHAMYEEGKTARLPRGSYKGAPAEPARWAVYIPAIYVGEEKSISGYSPK